MGIVFQLGFIATYMYFTYNIGEIEPGKGKAIILFLISTCAVVVATFFHVSYLGWGIVTSIFLLYDLFYDEEAFYFQWIKITSFGVFMIIGYILRKFIPAINLIAITEALCLFCFLFLSWKRSYVKLINLGIVTFIYGSIFILTILCSTFQSKIFISQSMGNVVNVVLFFLSIIIFLLLEITIQGYKLGYEISTRNFQQSVLQHQYEEIKNIYLNMRGWRHDYHNHLQVIKAYLVLGQLKEVNHYLDEIEKDLDRVDTYIKSGNLLIDAVLNSKLSLAEKSGININCKAEVSEEISATDIDLCVILSNLLENAIKACEKIEKEKRFLRIYITIIKKQLYISIQNSAKEELNFDERNYITSKRGNHGFGMKRVKTLTDKYEGYLNLQNEPGIFAAEITLPLEL